MKKILTAFLFSAIIYPIAAQITITQSAMPAAGDTIRYSTANISGVTLNLNKKGASQTWDYSALTPTGQDIYKYMSANKTPYAFYFLNQIGLKTADSIGASTFTFRNIYSFYSKSSSVFKANGIGYSFSGIPLAAKNTDDDEVYQFPLDFNDSDVSTFRFVFSIPGQSLFTYVQVGKRTNIVDGWGSITTPYKTYSDVLRVKTIVDEVDSLVTQFAKIPIPRKQVIYKWLTTTEHIPVLEITGTETSGVFTATQIRYRDKYNGMQSALRPHASFGINKTSGVVNTDTFKLSNSSQLGTNFQWQITPANSSAKFVAGTVATTRNPILVFTKAGVYTVSLIATNTFGTDDTTVADLITITDPNNSVKNGSFSDVALYPNPAGNILHITGLDRLASVNIYDITGKSVMQTIYPGSSGICVDSLKPGVYIISFTDGTKTGSIPFVKQ